MFAKLSAAESNSTSTCAAETFKLSAPLMEIATGALPPGDPVPLPTPMLTSCADANRPVASRKATPRATPGTVLPYAGSLDIFICTLLASNKSGYDPETGQPAPKLNTAARISFVVMMPSPLISPAGQVSNGVA